jgi:hypothetical protein
MFARYLYDVNGCCRQCVHEFLKAGNRFVGGFFESLKEIMEENWEQEKGTSDVQLGLHLGG